jgi:hypothetical protein
LYREDELDYCIFETTAKEVRSAEYAEGHAEARARTEAK